MKKYRYIVFNMLWILAIGFGMWKLLSFSATPGKVGRALANITETALPLDENRPTLIVFLHPKCSCSRATLSELEQLLPEIKGTKIILVFSHLKPEWKDSDLWRDAENLRGVHLYPDASGVETKKFGVATSGHTVLFNQDKELIFTGGITSSRGHIGENEGLIFLKKWHKTKTTPGFFSRVFGCGIFESEGST